MQIQSYTKKQKRILAFIGVAVLSVPLIYCGIWLLYRQIIWMPHISNATEELTQRTDDYTGATVYVTNGDSLGDYYYLSIPKFGFFDCYIGAYPSIIVDEAAPVQDKDGNLYPKITLENGSDFRVLVTASFSYNGSVRAYRCDVDRVQFSVFPDAEEHAFFSAG